MNGPTFGHNELMAPIGALVGLLSLALLVVWALSIAWVVRDADARGKPGCALGLVIGILAWPWGLLVYWLMAQPDRRAPVIDRPMPAPPSPPTQWAAAPPSSWPPASAPSAPEGTKEPDAFPPAE
jgi:hypothetical protein